MNHYFKRIVAVFTAVSVFAGCFAGCGKKAGSSASANELGVSLDHAYSSVKADLLSMTDSQRYINLGDKVLAYGRADYEPYYVIYDPASNTSKELASPFLKENSENMDIRVNAYLDESSNNIMVLYNYSQEDTPSAVELEVYDADFNLIESRSVSDNSGNSVTVEKIAGIPGGGSIGFGCDESYTYYFTVYDNSFKKVNQFPSDFTYVNDLFSSGNSVYVSAYGNNGIELCKIDPSSGSLTPVTINNMPSYASGFFPCMTDKYEFFCMDSTDIYGVNPSSNTCEPVVNFINSDFLRADISGGLVHLKDGRFLMNVYTDSNWTSADSWLLSERPADDFKNVKMISLSCMSLDTNLGRAILTYNRTHNDYRIAISEYSKYIESSDDYFESYQKAIDKMKADLTNGIVADLMIVDAIPFESFCSKGIFEDMTGHFSNFDTNSFFTNVLDSMKYNDKLYTICSGFTLSTLAAKTEIVGDRQGISFEDFMKICDNCGSDVTPFGLWTRDNATEYLISSYLSSLIDSKNGTCNFNTPEFARLLEFFKSFPEKYDEEEMNYDESERYLTNQNIFFRLSLSNVKNAYIVKHMYFDDAPVTYIGYPVSGSGGNGARIEVSNKLAMSSGSANKEACYDFLDFLLSEEYQESYMYDFPLNRKSFRKISEEQIQPEMEKNEKGQMVKVPLMVYVGQKEKELPDIPASYIDEIENYILGAKDSSYYNDQIISIIKEEAGSFYAGDQDAASAAANIQNRVTLYLKEQQ